MNRDDSTQSVHRWPFDPLEPEERDPVDLPGGTATEAQKKDDEKPKAPAKPVDPRPQAP
jgi:hypothetical protein